MAPTNNNSPIGKLGDDLIAEILIRLPSVRSAFRCKSVSQRWNSLISTPCFSRHFDSRLHMIGHAGEPEQPILTPSKLRESLLEFLPLTGFSRNHLAILDCCKELLLLGFPTAGLGSNILVCNPFTEQWLVLPPRTWPTLPGRYFARTRLVCEPCKPIALLDPNSGAEEEASSTQHHCEYRFRVVRLGLPTILDLFCSESGEWMNVGLELSGQFCLDKELGRSCMTTSVDGELYWINLERTIVGWNPFRPYDPPRSIAILPRAFYQGSLLSFSQGALHMIHMSCPSFLGELSVWRLEEEEEEEEEGGNRWRELYRASWGKLLERGICSSVVGHHAEKSEIVFLECFGPASIVSCNFRTKEIQILFDQGELQCGSTMIFQPRVHFWTPQSRSRWSKCLNGGGNRDNYIF
ncbi:unnamed protein product [Linum tenue]|uniref:F-box domain-containing protein n=1 Tax=Linum tenue TaxID=586396 RepID=A0AAV0QP30_9ROSI|nr:unnamed protein product [Linum tenue]